MKRTTTAGARAILGVFATRTRVSISAELLERHGLEVTPQFLGMLASGRKRPGLDLAIALEALLGIAPRSWIVTGGFAARAETELGVIHGTHAIRDRKNGT